METVMEETVVAEVERRRLTLNAVGFEMAAERDPDLHSVLLGGTPRGWLNK